MALGKIKKTGFYDELIIKEIDEDYLQTLYNISKERPLESSLEQPACHNTNKYDSHQTFKFFHNRSKTFRGLVTAALLLVLSTAIAVCFITQNANANKDKEKQIQIEGENQTLSIGPNGGLSEDGVGTEAYFVDTWEGVENLKVLFPELIVPENLPEEYWFKSLRVEKYPDGVIFAEYVVESKNKRIIRISQFMGLDMSNFDKRITGYDEVLIHGEKEIFLSKADIEDSIAGFVIYGNSNINVSCATTVKELLDIIDSLI